MTAVEIILLLIGVVFLVGSFFVMEKLSPEDISKVAELSEEELRVVMDRELENARGKIEHLVDEAMDLTVAKVQRTMERETNEKVMAISEYSDSVMEQLKKMNQEITFLYSMLGDKHVELNEAMEHLEGLIRDYESLRSKPLPQPVPEPQAAPVRQPAPQPVSRTEAGKPERKRAEAAQDVKKEDAKPEKQKTVFEGIQTETLRTDTADAKVISAVAADERPDVEEPQMTSVRTDAGGAAVMMQENEPKSIREQILDCYNEGNSVTDIARNLGLGIGEVKLIVDLYRGELGQ